MKPLVDCYGSIWIRAQSVNWLIDVFGEGYHPKAKANQGILPPALAKAKDKDMGHGQGEFIQTYSKPNCIHILDVFILLVVLG